MNCLNGCVEKDERGNIHINAGSIRPTMLKLEELLQPEEWTNGNGIELNIHSDFVKITGFSTKTARRYSRSNYIV